MNVTASVNAYCFPRVQHRCVRGSNSAARRSSSDMAQRLDIPEDAPYELRTLTGLGETLVATRPIAMGELVLSAEPLIIATEPLPPELQDTFEDSDEDGDLDFVLADVSVAHAFARASADERAHILQVCCGAEACSEPGHQIVTSARSAAVWCARHDAACASLTIAELERALVIFELNGFGQLADGKTNGATAIFPLGSKFSHRCLAPNCAFHGQAGRNNWRAVKRIQVLGLRYSGTRCLLAADLSSSPNTRPPVPSSSVLLVCLSLREVPMISRAVSVFGLYRIVFYFEAFVHESIILVLPPPTCTARTIAIRLHVYSAVCDAPPPPTCVCHTPYNIGYGNIV